MGAGKIIMNQHFHIKNADEKIEVSVLSGFPVITKWQSEGQGNFLKKQKLPNTIHPFFHSGINMIPFITFAEEKNGYASDWKVSKKLNTLVFSREIQNHPDLVKLEFTCYISSQTIAMRFNVENQSLWQIYVEIYVFICLENQANAVAHNSHEIEIKTSEINCLLKSSNVELCDFGSLKKHPTVVLKGAIMPKDVFVKSAILQTVFQKSKEDIHATESNI